MEQTALKKFAFKNALYTVVTIAFFILGEIPGFNPLWAKSIPAVPVVVAIAMSEGEVYGGVYGFLAGILIDTYAAHVFGVASAIFTVLGTACGLFVIYLMQNNLRTTLILTMGSAAVYGIICHYIIYGMWNVEGSGLFFTTRTVPMIFVTALWSFPAYYIIKKIKIKFVYGRG